MTDLFIDSFVKTFSCMTSVTEHDVHSITSNYISIIKKIIKLKKRSKLLNIIPKILTYVTILSIVAIPYILIIFKGIYSDVEKITKYAITAGGFIAGIANFIISFFGLTKKIFVYEQTKIRLLQEGARLLNFKNEDRYNKYNNVHDALDEFLVKVMRIIQYSVLKIDSKDGSSGMSHRSFESIGTDYLGLDKSTTLDIEIERARNTIKQLEEQLEMKNNILKTSKIDDDDQDIVIEFVKF
jgi:hypothetical protein